MVSKIRRFAPAALFGGLYFVLSTAPAYAYLDPGTGSILLQGIIGGVASALFIFRGYWYRLKARFAGGSANSDAE